MEELEVYEARSDAARGAIIVIHDWFGLLAHVRDYCDKLAAAGFHAIAPDLYGGRTAVQAEEAQSLLEELDEAAARSHLGRLAESVARESVPVCAVGFSVGGWLALDLAARANLRGVVAYYAIHENPAAISSPVLMHLAEVDGWDSPDAPERFFDDLGAKTRSEKHVYAGTEHSFANHPAPEFNAAAAAQAWWRTLQFLGKTA